MDDETTTMLQEQMVELAKEVILKGVMQNEMSPTNPQHQIIVTGAMIILACANSGLSIAQALSRLTGENLEDDTDAEKHDGHPGQYL